jgi:peptidoglycan/LPS O-acetylase OafA/YrhL
MQNLPPKIYFPGLNGLRFVAAFLVVVNHIETTKYHSGYPNYMDYPFLTSIGGLSVTLFFVLSGFLITYLLLQEKEHSGFIDIKKFYIKRILRIWPLYYLIVIITFFILNKIDFFFLPQLSDSVYENSGTKLFLFLLILPNIAAVIFPSIPYLYHTWSIGIEEQFYLIWPWVIRYTTHYLKIFLIIIVTFITIAASLRFTANHLEEVTTNPILMKSIRDISSCFSMFRINAMAIGGIGAWLLYYKKETVLKLLYRKELQWATIVLIILLFIMGPNIKLVKHEFYSVLFCIIILNLASNPRVILRLENKALNFLGRISYGIYMYHPFVIALSMGILKQLKIIPLNTHIFDFILYPMTFIITIALAGVSYYSFENRILKLRER